ncbi:3,4-dihydroxy-2-butanone-4-phosphate synthase [Oceanospirillum linum]|uniref:3,4-dihydroxy-2-butanone 4-phosphate synthase n=1 Tax=Oceanospirillum linum TaxID=966 RepID=A0A1T1H9D7_OCELI|nr:3,4-dihydroxy-2-butanone-4-phosphate synthase [Oceanospirillum linum]OOV86330.1 3,4-dihydroxy-2-butanone-4-phosphate synthase [Oceanospirillum linum]SEG47716.1 3,4-dihydroxy 2-butanone 4-phosphate synthase [Oleiphilus messinensis]SMP31153.1 3,4-dihydroxy 2-butanone 4-phosphate synthase [Oceanospirillum linum]
MNQQNPSKNHNLSFFGTPVQRVERAIAALQKGQGILVLDDEHRENEGDLIFAAETMTHEQMALMIRECSGIICLCLPEERIKQLELPMMVQDNTSTNHTNFTVSIEAATGVSTGVSAADRVTTIQAAIADNAQPSDLKKPGHVFPLKANTKGVLGRRGHTEASVDMAQLAGLKPFGVLCELTNEDGTMARLPEVIRFGHKHQMPVLTIEDIVAYRQKAKQVA